MLSLNESQNVQGNLAVDHSNWLMEHLIGIEGTDPNCTGSYLAHDGTNNFCESFFCPSDILSPPMLYSRDRALSRDNEHISELGNNPELSIMGFVDNEFDVFGSDHTITWDNRNVRDITNPAPSMKSTVFHKGNKSARAKRKATKTLAIEASLYHPRSEQPIKCLVPGCGREKEFGRLSDLKRHHAEQHTGVRLPCEICGQSFKRKYERINHLRKRHQGHE